MAIAVALVLLLAAVFVVTAMVAASIQQVPHAPVDWPADHDDIGRVRLISRLLFAKRAADAIDLDCTLVAVDGSLPGGVEPPDGLPFTLRVRCPDTSWFATRVEELLVEWADENRELLLELAPDHGRVRTTIASGGSSVHLELADAPALGPDVQS